MMGSRARVTQAAPLGSRTYRKSSTLLIFSVTTTSQRQQEMAHL
jgi:hypothetical protein